ncbi:MAG: lysophospholipid acyltransferase family protein [Nanoarchaeota archaeon]
MVYPIARYTVAPLLRLFIRKVDGLNNLPKPPFIIAANHESFLDPFLILAVTLPLIDQKIHYLAMKGRFWNLFGDGISRHWAGCVPLDEGKQNALTELADILSNGGIVGIFPGGPRSLDGRLTKGKTGAVRLALETKVPIVPVGLIGTFNIAPDNTLIPRPRRANIRFGKPIYYNTKNPNLKNLTSDLMAKIADLADKQYLYNE